MRALAWWGSAYLVGASSIAFWCTPTPLLDSRPEWSRHADVHRLRHDLERRTPVPRPPPFADRRVLRRHHLAGRVCQLPAFAAAAITASRSAS